MRLDVNIKTDSVNGRVYTIPIIDKTLANEGQCADAKATGDALAEHKTRLDGHDSAFAGNTLTMQGYKVRLDGHDNQLAEHEAKLLEHTNALDTVNNKAASLLSRINSIGANEVSYNNEESALKTPDGDANNVQEAVDALALGVADNKAEIENVKAAVSVLSTAIDNNTVDIQKNTDSLASLNMAVSVLSTAIDNLSADIDNIRSQINGGA